MDKELNLLLPLIDDAQAPEKVNDYEFHAGRIGRHGVVVMKCGIGKVNAAVGTLTLIDNFHPDCVINTGVAGGADPSMRVLDLLVTTGVAYHDVWQKIIDIARTAPEVGDRAKYGLICSGDKFISTAEEVADIKSHFPETLAVDMESAAIAQVCVMKCVPFNILRVVSDTPGQEENISQYANFWTDAPRETFMALCAILKAL